MRFDKAISLLIENSLVGQLYRRASNTTYVIDAMGAFSVITDNGDLDDPHLGNEDIEAEDWIFSITIDGEL